ncbi:hypothetical protein WR25_05278 [Diploscapter pachys]|uniref:PHD-type domain-containing protein n=1 Tax=Diploscapter pachys TaxID=2018661 RepID=A0A2A2LCJ4_9BILA|nr:hypothetical protein WR25_05278 [Diploscapter pachys]
MITSDEASNLSVPSTQSDVAMEDAPSNIEPPTSEPAPSTPITPVAPIPTRTLNRLITPDVTHRKVEPTDVVEWEWPIKSGDKWFLQEQIGELLDIKSFSRKFPDLSRRKIEPNERDYLMETYNIQKIMNEAQMRDMAAMRAMEIHDLMSQEYSQIYQEYQKVCQSRQKAIIEAKAREMEAIKNDAKKLAELREKALSSTIEFNKDLQFTKKYERKYFWDIQTSIIQSASNRWKVLPKERTRMNPYPVSLIQGQYQTYYKRFTSSEMCRLPLATVLDGTSYFPVHRETSPPAINVPDKNVPFQANNRASGQGPATPNLDIKPNVSLTSGRKGSTTSMARCDTCGDLMSVGQKVLKCASCPMQAHADCLDMNEEMIAVVQTYPWNCLDCKQCTICTKMDQEESIILCERCDRGYHTHCLNMEEAPQGQWICNKCVQAKPSTKQSEATPKRAPLTAKEPRE